jgi:hypothetical protein
MLRPKISSGSPVMKLAVSNCVLSVLIATPFPKQVQYGLQTQTINQKNRCRLNPSKNSTPRQVVIQKLNTGMNDFSNV